MGRHYQSIGFLRRPGGRCNVENYVIFGAPQIAINISGGYELDTEESISISLATLEYNPAWVESGFLRRAVLEEQIALYHAGQDTNTEHYRYAAFRNVLSSHSAFTDADIEHYIFLAHMDVDQAMARSALVDLLKWRGLTSEQFDRLSHDPYFAETVFQKVVVRRRLLTELASSAVVSAATFEYCLASKDATVQTELIKGHKLTLEQRQALTKQGVNRAIRNMARVEPNN